MASNHFATLSNGAKMPLLGYGTWEAKPAELERVLDDAIKAGYRHIDTATLYMNEQTIGKVINDNWISKGKLKREDLFLVTKLPMTGMRAASVEKYLLKSLKDLQTDYVDLYLIHLPIGFQEQGDNLRPVGPDGIPLYDFTTDHVSIWKAMEAQVDAGRARAIGISNFDERQIQRILVNSRIKPANLQVELHLHFQQKQLVDFCKKNGITVTAYSPLGSPGASAVFSSRGFNGLKVPDLFSIPTVKKIAENHKKTPGQVLLRHLVQQGIIAIPKSTNPERIVQNIQIFDFELSAEEMKMLNDLDQGKAGRIFGTHIFKGAEKHPECPHING